MFFAFFNLSFFFFFFSSCLLPSHLIFHFSVCLCSDVHTHMHTEMHRSQWSTCSFMRTISLYKENMHPSIHTYVLESTRNCSPPFLCADANTLSHTSTFSRLFTRTAGVGVLLNLFYRVSTDWPVERLHQCHALIRHKFEDSSIKPLDVRQIL